MAKIFNHNTMFVKDEDGNWNEIPSLVGNSGGEGGTYNYGDLYNKPSVNNVELNGNKTSKELGIITEEDLKEYVILKEIQGEQSEIEIDIGTISQGGFGALNENIASQQVCRTELLEANLNNTVRISGLPDNIKYQISYGDSSTYSTANPLKQLTSTYVGDSTFTINAKYIRIKFVAYDSENNRIDITPEMCSGIVFTTIGFNGKNVSKYKDKTIRVASSTATPQEITYADYVCDGVADEEEINQALKEIASMNGGELHLSSGKFFIDNFTQDSDGIYRAISVPAINGLTITIKGMGGMADGNIVGTCIDLSRSAYDELPTDTTEQRELFGQAFSSNLSSTVLYLSDIRFRTPGNKKPLIFIDLFNFGRATLEHVYGYAYKDTLGSSLNPAVEGLIGVRMLRGSNFGAENTYRSCGMNGFYEGWQIGSEHVLMEQCSAIYNVYGYTFGNYEWTNAFLHPITMIRCTDERNINLPLFKACGYYSSVHNKGQRISMIDFSVERKEDGTPGKTLGDLAVEVTDGTFNGDITFTMMNANNVNCVDVPFFQSGGSNFTIKNSLHKTYGTTELRLSYGANQGQQFYDTDLGAMFEYIDGEWINISKDASIDKKQDAPIEQGISGQVLGLDDELNPVWNDIESGSSEKEWQLLGEYDVTDVGVIELTDLDNITDFYIESDLVKNDTTTESGFNLYVNENQIFQNIVSIFNSTKDLYQSSICHYNGFIWECKKTPGAVLKTNIASSSHYAPYNYVKNVGKATKIKLIGANLIYYPTSGTIRIYGR